MYQIIVYIVIILTKFKFLKLIAKEKKEKKLKQMHCTQVNCYHFKTVKLLQK
jgi:hypothetical protein